MDKIQKLKQIVRYKIDIIMKKDLIFAPILLIIAAVLFLLKFTGMAAHIAVSVIGLAALVVYAVLTKNEWKLPALEIIMRAFYGIALISGIVIKVKYIAALATVHKIGAALFAVALLALFVHKLITAKKA